MNSKAVCFLLVTMVVMVTLIDNSEGWARRRRHKGPKGACHFPFEYEGKIYHSCTTVNHKYGRAWCSLTPVFEGKWKNCDVEDKRGWMETRGLFQQLRSWLEWATGAQEDYDAFEK
ncbi:PREDICTED: matrix metalloproteinase-9-like [Branchiostoma belcheri]|uniref:Matrix metalloproteinase-9-like n=1 Tax=Branchiostoma belcheri TaxID=7741 RepID=A0A6P4ZMT6_BRABE|nr:PREDICTED: matrix metalloproteinase-9-like [Branchiostoma belcheri]XP_019638099.1 PREDICTED: matrix metalloproteinase-9-like [Branchiostoma belcheri]